MSDDTYFCLVYSRTISLKRYGYGKQFITII